ncbi:MAG: ABC transporter permease [Acidimicrobiales bacterium]
MTVSVADPPRTGAVTQALALSRRAVISLARKPAQWISGILFPLFFAALSAAAFDNARSLPGFPEVDSYYSFLLPGTLIQAVLFGCLAAGVEMAIDMETGFFDRLVAMPISRISILVGRVGGAAVLGAFLAFFFSVVMQILGGSIQAGLGGLVVLVLVGSLLGIAVGSFTMAVALRTASQEAINGLFPVTFALVFFSSAFFPTALMQGWYRGVAEINPVTIMVNGLRHLVIVGWSYSSALEAVAIAAMFAILMLLLALWSLRWRLTR